VKRETANEYQHLKQGQEKVVHNHHLEKVDWYQLGRRTTVMMDMELMGATPGIAR
jgi:hypothetical protein